MRSLTQKLVMGYNENSLGPVTGTTSCLRSSSFLVLLFVKCLVSVPYGLRGGRILRTCVVWSWQLTNILRNLGSVSVYNRKGNEVITLVFDPKVSIGNLAREVKIRRSSTLECSKLGLIFTVKLLWRRSLRVYGHRTMSLWDDVTFSIKES